LRGQRNAKQSEHRENAQRQRRETKNAEKTLFTWRRESARVKGASAFFLLLPLLLLLPAPASANLLTGENAEDGLGQFSTVGSDTTVVYTTNGENNNDGSTINARGFNQPQDMVIDPVNNNLYVTDCTNDRVMVYDLSSDNSISTASGHHTASYVIGQSSLTVNNGGSGNVGQNTFWCPAGLAIDTVNSRLFVADSDNSRVLVFSTPVTSNNPNAIAVLGQGNFTNNNASTSQSSMSEPGNLVYDSVNNLLYEADTNNNRVMVFNTATTGTALSNVSSVTQSGQDACAITTAGSLYCWGLNSDGEGGFGDLNQSLVPQQVGSLSTWTVVTQGDPTNDEAACGIAGGKLYCWGNNAYGEDGQGNTTQYTSPQQVGSLSTWTAVSSGGSDTCGITAGKLYCWGQNNVGEDGLGNITAYTTPQQVGSLTTWTAVGQSGGDGCGITAGKLYCWGDNGHGEDGVGNTTENNSPVQVGSLTTWTAIGGPNNDTCGITAGKLYCWGYNQYGELGLGNTTQYTTPQQVGSLTTWTDITIMNDGDDPPGGGNWAADACGIAGGKLYCWGYNEWGEDGLGNTTEYKTPQQVGSLTNWTDVWFGVESTCGIAGGQLYCWGRNEAGELGVGNTTQYTSPQTVDVGAYSSGENAIYELGQPSGANAFTTSTAATTQSGMHYPEGLTLDSVNNRLFVGDTGNNRVLAFNVPVSANGVNASYVLGQSSWTTATTATTQAGMYYPCGVSYDPNSLRLFVADGYNNRILVFNVPPGGFTPLANGMNPSFVLGQSSWTVHTANTTQAGLDLDASTELDSCNVRYDPGSGRVFAADSANNRIEIFEGSFLPSWPADVP
jgi:alpha-tubulin suppressor-like RCC1 family protein